MCDVAAAAEAAPGITLVFTSHGIRDFGNWQDAFALLLKTKDPRIEVRAFNYPFFGAISFLLPWQRNAVIDKFRDDVIAQVEVLENVEAIFFVGHSFGTEVVMRGLTKVLRTHRHLPMRAEDLG